MAQTSKPLSTKKHDAEPEEPAAKWESHLRWIAPVSAGILIFATLFLWYQNRKTDIRAEVYQAYSLADSTEALEAVALAYPEQPEAAHARIQASAIHYNDGDYDSARVGYLAFLEQYPKHPLAESASWGLLLSEESLGNLDVAMEGYQTHTEKDLLYPQALFGQARIHGKRGEWQKAKDMYQQIQEKFPDSPWEKQAGDYANIAEMNLRKSGG